MRDPVGHVTVNERIPSQRFHRFVDEKVKDWMRDHQIDDSPAEYEVAFFDEDPLGEVSCLVVVHSGSQLWRSWETADNPRMALSRSLEQLHTDIGTDESVEEMSETSVEIRASEVRMSEDRPNRTFGSNRPESVRH